MMFAMYFVEINEVILTYIQSQNTWNGQHNTEGEEQVEGLIMSVLESYCEAVTVLRCAVAARTQVNRTERESRNRPT